MHISPCFVKRLKPSEASVSSKFRFGIKLARGEKRVEIFGEHAEQMNVWFDALKRLCLLPKFNKKHKLL